MHAVAGLDGTSTSTAGVCPPAHFGLWAAAPIEESYCICRMPALCAPRNASHHQSHAAEKRRSILFLAGRGLPLRLAPEFSCHDRAR